MSLLNKYTKEEFENIVKISNSWRDLTQKLGYNSHSGDLKLQIQKKVEEYNLDVSHFKTVAKNAIKRNEENIFIENSTANQSTVRKWYLKGNYTEYKCSICNLLPVWQGQKLTLILDHINGINNDDRLDNLRWVCPNCNIQLTTTGGRNRKNLAKKNYCIDCGKEISVKSIRCMQCNSKTHIIPIEQMSTTREELKKLIRTIPFTKIGEMFGVSDNAIRKWCDKFGLPRKVSEIKKYSNEEWEKI